MSYRNKTYVIFDGDNDMWAYAYMKGWKVNERVDFDFHDAHDLRPLTDRASKETVRSRLRLRFANAKQAIVLIGEHTRYLYKFVRWELEVAQELDLPIVAVNLNGSRLFDPDRCPPMLRDKFVVHVSFNVGIIRHALDNFPAEYFRRLPTDGVNRHYGVSTYEELGL